MGMDPTTLAILMGNPALANQFTAETDVEQQSILQPPPPPPTANIPPMQPAQSLTPEAQAQGINAQIQAEDAARAQAAKNRYIQQLEILRQQQQAQDAARADLEARTQTNIVTDPGVPIDRAYMQKMAQSTAAAQQLARDKAFSEQLQAQAQGEATEAYQKRLIEEREDFARKKAAADAQLDQAREEWQNTKIDPDRYWDNQGPGQLAAGLGIILGGLASGMKGGPNVALQMIQRNIDRDINAQKEDINKKKNAMNFFYRKLGDLNQAELLARSVANEDYQLQLQKLTQITKSPQIKIGAEQTILALQQQNDAFEHAAKQAAAGGTRVTKTIAPKGQDLKGVKTALQIKLLENKLEGQDPSTPRYQREELKSKPMLQAKGNLASINNLQKNLIRAIKLREKYSSIDPTKWLNRDRDAYISLVSDLKMLAGATKIKGVLSDQDIKLMSKTFEAPLNISEATTNRLLGEMYKSSLITAQKELDALGPGFSKANLSLLKARYITPYKAAGLGYFKSR